MLARLSLVLLLVAPPALALERLFVVGEARSMKDGELRYREYHHCSEDRSNYLMTRMEAQMLYEQCGRRCQRLPVLRHSRLNAIGV